MNTTGKAVKKMRIPTVDYEGFSAEVVPVQQNDVNSRILEIELYDDNGTISLKDYDEAAVECINYDVSGGYSTLRIDVERMLTNTPIIIKGEFIELDKPNNKIYIRIPGDIAIAPADFLSTVTLIKKNIDNVITSRLSSQNFYICIAETAISDEAITGYDKYGILVDILNKANEAINKANESTNKANIATKNANDATVKANNSADLANNKASAANTAANNANNKASAANTATNEANVATKAANEATNSAKAATNAANTAATNANQKAELANSAATNANQKADTANTSANNANQKANLANTAAINANEKAGLANSAATNANQKADLANTATTNANKAISNANTAADLANKAANRVDVSIQNAEKATTNANNKAGLADTAATNANNKAGLADTAATNANNKANLANTAATNANNKANLANTAADSANKAANRVDISVQNAEKATTNANNAANSANKASDKALKLTQPIDVSKINNVGIPSLSIGANGGLIAENFKGEKGNTGPTAVYVNDVLKDRVNFRAEPQTQIDSKFNKSGGVLSGNIEIRHGANADMSFDSTNPSITFSQDGAQPVKLMYTDYDNYRAPAGLKVVAQAANAPAWFETEGVNIAQKYEIKNKVTLEYNSTDECLEFIFK